jgi:hypothetical protein
MKRYRCQFRKLEAYSETRDDARRQICHLVNDGKGCERVEFCRSMTEEPLDWDTEKSFQAYGPLPEPEVKA